MDVEDLDYELPEGRIAQRPCASRGDARLMVLRGGELEHHRVRDLASLLERPCLFVVNDTRVLHARLFGKKAKTGGRVELLLVERLSAEGAPTERWLAMGRTSKPLRPGVVLDLGELRAEVVERREGTVVVDLEPSAAASDTTLTETIERVGHVPLPPYIRRPDEAADRERYQTVFAREPGAVAAPTAGLHFDEGSLAALEAAGHTTTQVTLHVGPGTFRPVKAERLEDHAMHTERYEVGEAAARAITDAREEGRPVLAVGTTVVRALEAAATEDGRVRAGKAETDILIAPPYRFRAVDALMTNFHLPRSTLLALVMAFAGVEETRAAYRAAVDLEYRFYSYGDAMLVLPGGRT